MNITSPSRSIMRMRRFLVRRFHHGSIVSKKATRVQFVVDSTPGCLGKALAIFSRHNLNCTHIESGPKSDGLFNMHVDIGGEPSEEVLNAAVADLCEVLPTMDLPLITSTSSDVVWFPMRMADLDSFASKVMEFGEELDADHPGFQDPVYRARRKMIVDNAKTYKTGMALPHIDYTEQEVETWGTVFNKLSGLFPTHSCVEHRNVFEMLKQNCGYSADRIPQLAEVSAFLRSSTGFRLRPVMGLLSPRDFLNGLAFRVFHSTQYIRHHSKPMYTPEPDVCHELLGHAPLLADPEFAQFSQEIGLASLGATDDEIKKLSSVYWFTVEFGLCRENGATKAFGAGLLSSFGELQYCIESDAPQRVTFDPEAAAATDYPITQYQPLYYVADSFKSATDKIRAFARSFHRPFSVTYDPYTQRMRVLDNKREISELARQIQNQSGTLADALSKIK